MFIGYIPSFAFADSDVTTVLDDLHKDETFNIDDYPGNYCMRCKTRDEAEKFMSYLDNVGRTWKSGRRYSDRTYAATLCSDIAFYFNKGTVGNVTSAYRDDRYIVLEFSDFISTENSEKTTISLEEIFSYKGV